jgi:hypothetical protein
MENQLVKSDTGIQFSSNPIMIALQGRKIKDTTDKELAGVVSDSIEKAVADLGLRDKNDDDLDLLKISVFNECRSSFGTLTLDEFKHYIHSGIRGKYKTKDEIIFLSVINISKWLYAGMTDVTRQDARKQLTKLKEEATEPTPDEKFTMGKQLCLVVLEQYKAQNTLPISSLAVYSFLNKYGMIDSSYKKGITAQALEETIFEKEKAVVVCLDIFKRRGLNAELEAFRNGVEKDMLNREQWEEVKRTMQKIALRNYFTDLIMNEDDLSELIEAARP